MKATIRTLVPVTAVIPDDAEIQNCEMAFKCPMYWGDLISTDDLKIRFCTVCSRNVHFCSTSDDLWGAQRAGLCVAYLAERRVVKRVLMGIPCNLV